jgi:hypothetical protein
MAKAEAVAWISPKGYIRLRVYAHPHRRRGASVYEHVLVMEAHLGRRLTEHECVHHIDGDKRNNALSNLQLDNWSDHQRHHAATFKRDACGRLMPKKRKRR